MDMLSSLPWSTIETILCFLPIQDAARTSILSKEWRYYWIGIPKLTFIEDTFRVSTKDDLPRYDTLRESKQMTKRRKLFYAIFQVLLIHEGKITDFTLLLNSVNSRAEIDYILNHLSRKNSENVKKLTLKLFYTYNLNVSLFSFCGLTDLYLNCCKLDYQPTFDGFRSLTNLYVEKLFTSKKMLLHLLSSSSLLKIVTLRIDRGIISLNDDSTLLNFFDCFPVIEKLTVLFSIVECFVKDRVPKELTTTLVHLKYLCIERITFMQRHGIPFLVLLIKSSPNLQKLKLAFCDDIWLGGFTIRYFALEDYSDIWLEHLNELEIIRFVNRENELDFVKFMLVKSPVLKKVMIFLDNEVDTNEELEIWGILLQSPHASPAVEIIIGKLETN